MCLEERTTPRILLYFILYVVVLIMSLSYTCTQLSIATACPFCSKLLALGQICPCTYPGAERGGGPGADWAGPLCAGSANRNSRLTWPWEEAAERCAPPPAGAPAPGQHLFGGACVGAGMGAGERGFGLFFLHPGNDELGKEASRQPPSPWPSVEIRF